ncbi:MAG TPA: site-2 protease family protein [Leptospiraceae bacterium]|nr:site-2 protease family protein [Leptospirales bacterium]HMX57125.1 site-2 protease family protein [Leptospiraceae bacterium]HMZ36052.1 site-2 protease family protein [Leptospiraceae bacterium]HNE23163.1 site-2 protease family protein [Leptospiraceae bacterium]HNJ04807.1 site-2 protease family protein [Leptospiraceae bacterium]
MIALILGGALMLGICVFIHELGHYTMGRLVGVKAEIFSIGYGRGIWKKKIGDTTWQVTAIPIGGYVKFYGDDISGNDKTPGGLFSVPPLTRIIPVLGGPLFNLILGFGIFLLLHTISGPIAPRVDFWEETMQDSPAYRAGLRSGDSITAINGEAVHDFHDLQKLVLLSGGADLTVDADRNGSKVQVKVKPEVDTAGRALIGLRAPGERNLKVNYPSRLVWAYKLQSFLGHTELPAGLRAYPYLNNGDVILSVQGRNVKSATELQDLLGEFHGQPVQIRVKRQTLSWLAPWFTEETTVTVPSQAEYRIELHNLVDLKYGTPVADQVLLSNVEAHQRALSILSIDGKPPGSYEKMYEALATERAITLTLKDRNYSAKAHAAKIGLLGFRPDSRIETTYLPGHGSVSEVISHAFGDTAKNVMVYPAFFGSLISGRLSFIDNAMGPVGMFAAAGVVLESGIQDYLGMFAAISIALFIMNLLPFPVVDGGHVVFFLYEAVRGKPVTPGIMEGIYRGGLAVLVFMGLWIMYRDILFISGL